MNIDDGHNTTEYSDDDDLDFALVDTWYTIDTPRFEAKMQKTDTNSESSNTTPRGLHVALLDELQHQMKLEEKAEAYAKQAVFEYWHAVQKTKSLREKVKVGISHDYCITHVDVL